MWDLIYFVSRSIIVKFYRETLRTLMLKVPLFVFPVVIWFDELIRKYQFVLVLKNNSVVDILTLKVKGKVGIRT